MTSTPTRRILVIGAGIGGLTTAIALRNAGVEAVVYERADALEQIQGRRSSIHMWTNGMRGLQLLGVGDRAAAAGAPFDRAEVLTPRGRRIVDWPVAEMAERLRAPTVGIIRADLHSVLVGALDSDAIRFGARCTAFEQHSDGVIARFADGREERGDVLVGADGLTSTIREQLLADGPPVYTGRIQWQATLTPPEGLVPPRLYNNCWGRGKRFSYYPIPGGVCWYTMVSTPPETAAPPGGSKAEVLGHYRGWPEPYEALIDATPEEAVDRLLLVARQPGNRWAEGRVVLLGDAAHAMPPDMGQGSALAIEDGIVLARHLAAGGEVIAALRAFEEERLGRVNRIGTMGWRIARLGGVRNPAALLARNLMVRVLSPRVAWNRHQQDMAYEF